MKFAPLLLLSLSCSASPARGPLICPVFLDSKGSAPLVGSVVTLRNASALHVANVLNESMADAQRRAAERSKGCCVLYPPGSLPVLPQLRPFFLADSETNTLLAEVPADDVERVLALLERFDAEQR